MSIIDSPLNIIAKYFPDLNAEQIKQFQNMYGLYQFWNDQINVVSRKDFQNLYLKHVLHSLSIAKVFDFVDGSRILDIGTGGGFPAIPLAVLFPNVEFVAVDSIGKKIKVVNEVAHSLGLKNVIGLHQRAEKTKGKFDFVISRAVTRLDKFIPWTNGKFKNKMINAIPNGIIYLKGGDLTEELNAAKDQAVEIYPIQDIFEEKFFETKKIIYIKMV